MAHENVGKVMTVLGPIMPEEMGVTLPHEHLYIDLTGYRPQNRPPEEEAFYYQPLTYQTLNRVKKDPYNNRDNLVIMDREVTLRELSAFQKAGGRTICDVMPGGVKHGIMEAYAPRLVDAAVTTGLNVISGFGHYVACCTGHGESDITLGQPDPTIEKLSPEEIARDYIDVILNGFGDTGVRPGIIGELGTSDVIFPEEKKALQAGAIAQQETGLAITLHMHPPVRNGHEALDILLEAGADAQRIIHGHSDGVLTNGDGFEDAVSYYLSLLDRGCYLEFDLCGNAEYFRTETASWWLPQDRDRALAIARLCEKGYEDKILLSHDMGTKYCYVEYGGWGYAHVVTDFRRTLLEAGIDEQTAIHFSTDNPQRIYTII